MGPSPKPIPSIINCVHAGRDGLGDAAGTLGRWNKGPGFVARSSAHPPNRYSVIQATTLPCLTRQYEQTQEPKCSQQF